MLKKLLTPILIPALLFAAETVTHTYTYTTAPVVQNGTVKLAGCRPARIGFAPMVAVQPVRLLLPTGYKAVDFTVAYSTLTPMKEAVELAPFQPSTAIGKKPYAGFHTRRSEDYRINTYFPGFKRAKWFSNQLKHGHSLFITTLNPVQYNPITGQLAYHKSITVTVEVESMTEKVNTLCSPGIRSDLESFVDNKEAAKKLALTRNRADFYEYLIISTDGFKDSWTDLIEFNKRRSLRTKIQTIDWIKSNMQGADNQEKMRNYIIQEYENSKITYVMLGGDGGNIIPDRSFRAQMYDNYVDPGTFQDEKDLCAEMYYECLDGDWKGSNQYYGEPGAQDMTWEVFVGRFPVDNTSELANIINKTIKYQESPNTEVNNMLLAGGFAWDDWGVEVWGGDAVEEHVGNSDANSFSTFGFPESEWTFHRLYEKTGQWNASDLREKLCQDKCQWLIHEGHGNATFFANESISGVTTSNYTNDGTNANFFFLVTGACYPGDFDGTECILERFVEIETGAYACIGCDKTGWGDNDGSDGSTHRIYRYMVDALFNPDIQKHHVEAIHAASKEAQSDIVLNTTLNDPPYYGCITYCVYETNLLGDPAVSIWTKTPQELTLNDLDVQISNKIFTCDTKGPYSWVAVCKPDGEIITTQLTGKDGKCNIDDQVLKDYLNANPGVTLKVRVKAHNYLPFESDIPTGISNVAVNHFNRAFFFNGKTASIKYTLPGRGMVNISVFNSKGALVKTAFNGYQNAGINSVLIRANELSSGIYYLRMSANNNTISEKFIVAK